MNTKKYIIVKESEGGIHISFTDEKSLYSISNWTLEKLNGEVIIKGDKINGLNHLLYFGVYTGCNYLEINESFRERYKEYADIDESLFFTKEQPQSFFDKLTRKPKEYKTYTTQVIFYKKENSPIEIRSNNYVIVDEK
jgi:hypothetical protein